MTNAIATGNEVESRLPPTLGEQNELVYGDMLGLSKAQINQLIDDGIIGEKGLSW